MASDERRSNLVVVRGEDAKSDEAVSQKKRNGGIAQLARAPALQAGGRRFDSDYLHKLHWKSVGYKFYAEIYA